VNVAYVYPSASFQLGNADDEVVLLSADLTEIDRVEYDNGLLWPDTPGLSLNLRPDSLDYLLNDSGNYWCGASSPIGGVGPDAGTPDATNDTCP
jgi:hypothetical protein